MKTAVLITQEDLHQLQRGLPIVTTLDVGGHAQEIAFFLEKAERELPHNSGPKKAPFEGERERHKWAKAKGELLSANDGARILRVPKYAVLQGVKKARVRPVRSLRTNWGTPVPLYRLQDLQRGLKIHKEGR